jgi:hypothetical protein
MQRLPWQCALSLTAHVLPAGVDNLPPEFKVTPASGELPARSDVRLVVEFSALEKKELAESLRLEVGGGLSGNLNGLVLMSLLPVCCMLPGLWAGCLSCLWAVSGSAHAAALHQPAGSLQHA